MPRTWRISHRRLDCRNGCCRYVNSVSLIAYSWIIPWRELCPFFLLFHSPPGGFPIPFLGLWLIYNQSRILTWRICLHSVSGSGLVPERASQVAPHDDEAGRQKLVWRRPGERKGGHVTRPGQLQWSQSVVPDEWPAQSPFDGLTAESDVGKCNIGAKTVVVGDNDKGSWPEGGAAAEVR